MNYEYYNDSDNEYESVNKLLNSTYNKSGVYTLYTIKSNPDDETAFVNKVENINGYEMEEIIQKFLYKKYQNDYLLTLIEVKEYFSNPNYIQDRVSAYTIALFLDGFIGNTNNAINEYIENLKQKMKMKILFVNIPYKPKSFDFIVQKYNLPNLLEKDKYELYDNLYDGIDFIITYDSIIQT